MAVVAIANAKGGSGKTTAAVLLATELANSGSKVVILDCDPLRLAADWVDRAGASGTISVVTDVTAANLPGYLRAFHRPDCDIIIDLSAARDVLVALALGVCDLALIAVQGSAMDARGAVQVLELIQFIEANARSRINRAVVLSRVNPLVTTHSLSKVRDLLLLRGMPMIETPIVERAAFRQMFERAGTLYTVEGDRNAVALEKARANMQAFARDVMRRAAGAGRADAGPYARMCYQREADAAVEERELLPVRQAAAR